MGLERLDRPSLQCAQFADAALDVMRSLKPSLVIVAARWALYFEGTRYGFEEGPSPLLSTEGNFDALSFALDTTLARLASCAVRTVLVQSIPEIGVDVPSMLARALILGREVEISLPRTAYDMRQERSAAELARQATRHHALVLGPAAYLCDSTSCDVQRNGLVLYADSDHLSPAGARLLAPMFDGIFTAAAEAPPSKAVPPAALDAAARQP
jgi:hypothetical protein